MNSAAEVRRHWLSEHAPAGVDADRFFEAVANGQGVSEHHLRMQLEDMNKCWRMLEAKDPARAALPAYPLSRIHQAEIFRQVSFAGDLRGNQDVDLQAWNMHLALQASTARRDALRARLQQLNEEIKKLEEENPIVISDDDTDMA